MLALTKEPQSLIVVDDVQFEFPKLSRDGFKTVLDMDLEVRSLRCKSMRYQRGKLVEYYDELGFHDANRSRR